MNPTLYQINTRVWRHRFGKDTPLLDVPDAYWKQLSKLGVHYVWLMGVWQTGPNVLNYALEPGLQEEYTRVLPDWTEQDIIGSPYAIDRYVLHENLGKPADLAKLRKRLNKHGLKLILDFVPNHFHAESSWIAERPDVFLEVTPPLFELDNHTFFRSPASPDRVFAHGKDPYFAAWQDTIQVNYASANARQFMQGQLLEIADLCDGVRCDMAMLPLPAVFRRTWEHALGMQVQEVKQFWPTAIQEVRNQHPNFCFIAEVYWDMEWELQQLGFDYTYDKRLRDRLIQLDTSGVRDHLRAEPGFQERSVRFLENHDEDRILSEIDADQAQAAAMVAYTSPGLRFFYEGQWEGRVKRLPVQLGRQPAETNPLNTGLKITKTDLPKLLGFESVSPRETVFYQYLLNLLQHPTIQEGYWSMVPITEHPNVLCMEWRRKDGRLRILVNYQQNITQLQASDDDAQWIHYPQKDATVSFPLTLRPFQWMVLEKAN